MYHYYCITAIEPRLILSSRHNIQKLSIHGNNTFLITNLTNAVGVDYDWKNECVFWSEVTKLTSSIKKFCKGKPVEVSII